MKDRCNQPNHSCYARYGERRITYDPAWETYEAFLADMGERPAGTTLDRRNNDLGYSNSNCRWATRIEQDRNRSDNVFVEYKGRTQVLVAWSEELGIAYTTLYARLYDLRWSVERAFSVPVRSKATINLTHDGRTLSTAEWARETGIANVTIRHRIKTLGWDVDKTLTTPVGGVVL